MGSDLASALGFSTPFSYSFNRVSSSVFSPASGEPAKSDAIAKVTGRLAFVESVLADGRDYLTGPRFTIADAYLFTLANWTGPTGIGLEAYPSLTAYQARVASRPAVQAALEAEGLLQAA